ncbi:MAG TPA: transcriptional regulator [Phycisphaerae bacterium]|nr:transcriptional regulator [Phycisphaerae bacterium]HOJ75399.1 transcriptional regulator [Phycisphaerae bacterium]HOM52639.1 transcriptional regulator [Phycisphaerae bacterium]HON67887.1 transcriptional regulator [Phycisphaerae bacterium]HOQ88357.1 transcriptional regulator [Phycisphaerae bacterium]
MTEETFRTSIEEARQRINELPEGQRGALLQILDETIERHRELEQNFARVREAVAEWQLMIKYLIFDREATIRERDELRRKLGNQGL